MSARPVLLRPFLVLGIALLVGACGSIGSSGPATPGPDGSPVVVGGSPLIGKPAPAIDSVDLAGQPVSLTSYAGRPVVVNFWASWCIPCRDEFPEFVAARERYQAPGLEILGVVHKDSTANAQAFATDHHAAWPLVQDPGERIYDAYLGFGVPMTVFIDAQGIVRSVSFGPLSEAGLEDQVKLILPAA